MKVSVIVPAYNEAPHIGSVLKVLISYHGFAEVIVVDDGSTDGTGDAARERGARVVTIERNLGKGAAMERGVQAAHGDVLFFCDADIIGLTHAFIDEVAGPVVRREKDMFVGVRANKIRRLPFGLTWTPLLDGQRAVTRALWESTPPRFKSGYGIEPALNHAAARSERGYGYQAFDEISQVRKEQKYGLLHGKIARLVMYGEVGIVFVALTAQGMVSWVYQNRDVDTLFQSRCGRAGCVQEGQAAEGRVRLPLLSLPLLLRGRRRGS